MDTNKMREQFEAAFVAELVAKQGEGYRSSAIHLLKRDGDFEKPPTAYELSRRERGMYDSYWVEMAWWAWQASRASVVVELPPKWNDATHSNKQAWDCGIDDARMAIEAQGLKVKP